MTDTLTALSHLIERQRREREQLVAQLLDAERDAAIALVNETHPLAGAALVEAIAGVERQIRADVKADRLLATVQTDLPAWADRTLPPLDDDDVAAGRRSVVIYIPRAYAIGGREHVAMGLVDLTDSVFGPGSRHRRDQQLAADQEAEHDRAREIAHARALAAARR